LVAGPLGTLPELGDITCAQDVVVAITSDSIKLCNPPMAKALPLKWQALSARSFFTIPSGALFSSLSWFSSAWFSLVHLSWVVFLRVRNHS
jgi:hypothetical protein